MPFQIKTLFNDPTPDGYIHARYVIPMLKIAQDHTDFSEEELHEFVRHMMLVAKKMAATWLAMRFKEGLGYVHIPKPLGSLISPIVVLPDNAVSRVIQIMSLLQRKSQRDGTVSNPTVSGL